MAVSFEIETTRIPVGKDGFFDVRGLNSEDITFLVTHYLDDVKNAVAKYGERSRAGLSRDALNELILAVAADFPMMVVEIISRAADDTTPEAVEKFRRLAFVKQITALKAISYLSVEDGAVDLKKVLGVVSSLLEANGLTSGPLMKSLRTTIDTFGKQSAT